MKLLIFFLSVVLASVFSLTLHAEYKSFYQEEEMEDYRDVCLQNRSTISSSLNNFKRVGPAYRADARDRAKSKSLGRSEIDQRLAVVQSYINEFAQARNCPSDVKREIELEEALHDGTRLRADLAISLVFLNQ